MNVPRLLASRHDIAVDGLCSTLALYRNKENEFEWVRTCPDDPEEGYREVATSEDVSEFLMDRDTVLALISSPSIAATYTPAALAERWSVSDDTVRGMIHSGEVAAFRVGPRMLRVRADTVEAFELANFNPAKPIEERQEAEQREGRRAVALSALRTGWKRQKR